MRLTDEKIADVKEYLSRSMKVTASSLIPQLSKYGIDLIDTIEALQQENEQLQAQAARVREALIMAREAIKAAWSDGSANAAMDKASEALAEIDKAIGGKAHE